MCDMKIMTKLHIPKPIDIINYAVCFSFESNCKNVPDLTSKIANGQFSLIFLAFIKVYVFCLKISPKP